MNKLFKEILAEMQKEYVRHQKIKGHSWQRIDIDDLRLLFFNAYFIFEDIRENTKEELDQIIDLANILLMLGQRLIKNKEVKQNELLKMELDE